MSILGPSLFDLFLGRVGPLEWTQDRVRSLTVWGDETAHSVEREEVGDPWDDMEASLSALGFELVDFRTSEKSKRGSRKGSRPFSQIRGPCFHQTGGPVDDVERCVNIPADVLITPSAVGIAHPPTAYLYAQHAGNRNYNSIEVSCRAAGIEGNEKTFWRRRAEKRKGQTHDELVREPTNAQLDAAMVVATYQARLNALAGHPHTHYVFHRNTHKSRVSDIGSRGALFLGRACREQLGLNQGAVLGSGKETPGAWGGREGVRYSWRVAA